MLPFTQAFLIYYLHLLCVHQMLKCDHLKPCQKSFNKEKIPNFIYKLILLMTLGLFPFWYSQFSHDVTKIQTKELSILVSVYFHEF